MKEIQDYEIEFHGITHNQYFRGVSTVFTDYETVVTGIGKTEKDAFNDVLDQVAQIGYDPASIDCKWDIMDKPIEKYPGIEPDPETSKINPELWIRVSIYLK